MRATCNMTFLGGSLEPLPKDLPVGDPLPLGEDLPNSGANRPPGLTDGSP